MSTTTIKLTVSANGLLQDLPTIPKLKNVDNAFGVRRQDTGGIVVASNTSFTRQATGTYVHTFTDPASNLTYEYGIEYEADSQINYALRQVASNSTANNLLAVYVGGHYSSASEVIRQLGDTAVDLMVEDWDQNDTSPIWEDILEEVDETINLYIAHRYPVNSFTSNFLRRKATIFACHLLSQRRGNPSIFLPRITRIYEELDRIRVGDLLIHDIKPNGIHDTPMIRNYQMQPHLQFPQRVDPTKSMGKSYGGMHIAFQSYLYTY